MPSTQIERVTMFKVTSEEGKAKLAEGYKKLNADNKRGSRQPYIVSLAVGPASEESPEISRGYNFIAKSTFASKDDMDFYEKECPAHIELKKIGATVIKERPLTVWFENVLSEKL